MTRDELTAKVKSLHNVGGLYEIIALIVEADNAPYVESSHLSPRSSDVEATDESEGVGSKPTGGPGE